MKKDRKDKKDKPNSDSLFSLLFKLISLKNYELNKNSFCCFKDPIRGSADCKKIDYVNSKFMMIVKDNKTIHVKLNE